MKKADAPSAPEGASGVPLHHQIAWIARELWEQQGCPAGRDKELWLKAEKIVLKRHEPPADLPLPDVA